MTGGRFSLENIQLFMMIVYCTCKSSQQHCKLLQCGLPANRVLVHFNGRELTVRLYFYTVFQVNYTKQSFVVYRFQLEKGKFIPDSFKTHFNIIQMNKTKPSKQTEI